MKYIKKTIFYFYKEKTYKSLIINIQICQCLLYPTTLESSQKGFAHYVQKSLYQTQLVKQSYNFLWNRNITWVEKIRIKKTKSHND